MRNKSILLPGILGGLTGILAGAVMLLLWLFSWSSSHVPGSWLEGVVIPPVVGAFILMMLGAVGASAALMYSKSRSRTAQAILASGLLGFPVCYLSGSYLIGGWIYWIIPGTLLTAAGITAMITPERLFSTLPLLNSDRKEIRLLSRLLYGALFTAGLVLVMGGLLIIGIMLSVPDNSPEGNAAQDQRDFETAAVDQSMGLLNESLGIYDGILARNQSNIRAWYEKGNTLKRLGRYDEALICFERALEIDPGHYDAKAARAEVSERLGLSREREDAGP